MNNTQKLGGWGEELAKEYLLKLGYKIIKTNFRNKIGEIDIIAKDGNMICFVEVKTRRTADYGQPFESVHYFKRRKMCNLALSYLKYACHNNDMRARFDVVSIYCPPQGPVEINHIKNAFDAVKI
jgi:putative endonuclease